GGESVRKVSPHPGPASCWWVHPSVRSGRLMPWPGRFRPLGGGRLARIEPALLNESPDARSRLSSSGLACEQLRSPPPLVLTVQPPLQCSRLQSDAGIATAPGG